MKKIIIGLMIFFNFGITISNHEITLNVGSIAHAQPGHQGEPRCGWHAEGPANNGTDPNWWDTFTGWIMDLIGDIRTALGELYDDGVGGVQPYSLGSLYYPWGIGTPLPYIDVYYTGYEVACFETPSIYGGPYRGGSMMNCDSGPPTYIDCAFSEHNTTENGIVGRSNEIAYLDECNECVGGSTGLPACSSPLYYVKLPLHGWDTTKYYSGDTITIDRGNTLVQLTLYNEHGVTPPVVSWDIYPYYFWYWGVDVGNTFGFYATDNSINGYTVTSLDGAYWGYTTISTNYIQYPPRTDTVKPTKVNCDSIDTTRNIRAVKSTQILDFISNSGDSAIIKDARDRSALRKFEVGFTIRKLQPTPGNYTYKPANYDTTGSSKTVTAANNTSSIAYLHVHPGTDSAGVKNNQSQSPRDFYEFLEAWNDSFYVNKYEIEYVISGDSAHNEFAIVISDSAKAKLFLLNHSKNTVINLTPGSPNLANWFGTPSLIGSYFHLFQDAVNKFATEGYPKELLNTYANVYMLQQLNLGISMQQKVNGQFKELNFVEETDSAGKKHFKITICQ